MDKESIERKLLQAKDLSIKELIALIINIKTLNNLTILSNFQTITLGPAEIRRFYCVHYLEKILNDKLSKHKRLKGDNDGKQSNQFIV